MKYRSIFFIALVTMTIISGYSQETDPSGWSSEKRDKWFEKGDWLGGWQVKPDQSINRKLFSESYFRNKKLWDKAFEFLKTNNLRELETKKYVIDGDRLYATVSEYLTKDEADARYEAHRKYIDIQYVVSGKELIGISPLSQKEEVLEPYNDEKDIEFLKVTGGKNHIAMPDRFFILFPEDAHRPGIKDEKNSPVRKVVVKVIVEAD